MMYITDLKWYSYRIPLCGSFTTAHGAMAAREGAILEIMTEDGISGTGEIAPLPEFGGDDLGDALAPLPTLKTLLCGKTLIDALHSLYQQQEPMMLPASTVCGLEIALLDALGKTEKCGISTLLASTGSPPRAGVYVNTVIGAPTTAAAVQRAQEAVTAGFSCVKLKVGAEQQPEDVVKRVAAVRAALGPTIALRLDANEAWTFEQARTILTACEPFAIQYIEQPLKAFDLTGMHTLRQMVSIPIAADEAVYNVESARRILDWEAADILIIKPQLAGGLHVSQQIIHEATKRGIQSVVTSTIETGIGLLGVVHLAAATPDITLECGLATLSQLTDDLLLTDLPIRNGFMALPTAPGLGIALDRDALMKYSIDITPSR